MSEKNRDAKRSARERMHDERVRAEARRKRKRTLMVLSGVVLVIAVAAVIGVVVSDTDDVENNGPVAVPAGASGDDKLVIPVGAADAPSTLTVYEDFRCPACTSFETTYRDTLHELEDSGQLRTDYHLVTLIDGNLGGSGSLDAGNAAACAQDASRFRDYHDVLYANQPEETDDTFADETYLLELADKVSGLRTAAFTECVNDGTYTDWIKKSDAAFGNSGHQSTPTVLLNGESIYSQSEVLTPAQLKAAVAEANKGKKAGKVTPSAAR